MRLRRRRKGFTLVELLCCLTFFSLTVYPMLSCITWSTKSALRSQDELLVSSLVQDAIETQRINAYSAALTQGTTTTHSQPTGMPVSVTVTTVVTLVTGYTDLYSVAVTGSWTDTVLNNNTSTIAITTYMRAPHV